MPATARLDREKERRHLALPLPVDRVELRMPLFNPGLFPTAVTLASAALFVTLLAHVSLVMLCHNILLSE